MLNEIINSREVRTQKATQSTQSSGSSTISHRSKEWLEIKNLKESLRQQDEEMRWWDKAMRQQNEYYAQAFAQQQAMLQVS
jgi:hypothetical protein